MAKWSDPELNTVEPLYKEKSYKGHLSNKDTVCVPTT